MNNRTDGTSTQSNLPFAGALDVSGALAGYLASIESTLMALKSPKRSTAKSTADLGGVTVAPGSMVRFVQTGYCMDPSIPAPGSGELLRLVPTDSLIPNELLPIYKAVLAEAARTDQTGSAYRNSMQALVWAFRTAGSSRFAAASNLSPSMRNLIDAAYPNGAATLMRYHASKSGAAESKANLANLVSRAAGIRPTFTPKDFAENGDDNRIVAQQMQTLLGMPVQGAVTPGSEFTSLADGVAAKAIGSGPLAAAIEIVNTSPRPFRFNHTDWSAETQRRAQRVALTGNLTGPLKSAPLPAVTAEAIRETEKTFTETFIEDLTKFRLEKFLEYAPDSKYLQKIANLRASAFTRPILNSTPLLGNILSLHEAATGTNWMTGEELSTAERALSMIGTIPGAGALARLGSSVGSKVISQALSSAATHAIPRAADRVALAKDVANWAVSDTVRMASERLAVDSSVRGMMNDAKATYERILA